jgi:DNA gyrase subunit A
MGRTASGLHGIRLKKDDYVVGMDIVEETDLILTITENGFGRRTPLEEYRIQGRHGSGLINMKIRPRNGLIVDVESVREKEEIIMLTQSGMVIRYSADGVRIASRQSIGVRSCTWKKGTIGGANLPSTDTEEPSGKTASPKTVPPAPTPEPEPEDEEEDLEEEELEDADEEDEVDEEEEEDEEDAENSEE